MGETPVVLFAALKEAIYSILHLAVIPVEEMLYLPGELGAVPLVDQPQVGCGMTAPSRGLGLTIALGVARYRQMGQGDFLEDFSCS